MAFFLGTEQPVAALRPLVVAHPVLQFITKLNTLHKFTVL